MSSITIEKVESPEQMQEILSLQGEIWNYGQPGADSVYPVRALVAFSESGGLVARALDADQTVGFSVAWIGRLSRTGDFYLHSQLVGVLPAYRQRRVGYRLKLFQRDFALQKGLSLIRWTFDPLQSRNARFNLSRLGAVAREYRPDFYGRLENRFSSGLSSDRLWADWHLASARVEARIERPEELPPVREAGTPPFPVVSAATPEELPDQVLVEIPTDFDAIRASDRVAALDWQQKVREALTGCFARGFIAHDLLLCGEGDERRAFYVLSRRPLEEMLRA